MVNILKLKAKLTEKNMTQKELAEKMEIDPSSLNKKLNNEIGETLTIEEANKLKVILNITKEEVLLIFFEE